MKFINQLIHSFLFLLFITNGSYTMAQTTAEFPKEINLMKMTDAGIAIVGTDDALYGVDSDGTTLWSNKKLRKVEENRVQILKGSEFIFVSDKGLGRNRVLNVYNGEEYANDGIKGKNILGARLIHGSNQVWVLTSGNHIEVWSLATNSKLYDWGKSYFPFGVNVGKMANLTATFDGNQPVTYTGKDQAIIHGGVAHLGKFDLNTGQPIWQLDWKPFKIKPDKGFMASAPSRGFGVMKIDDATNMLYFPFMNQLLAIDAETGNLKWDAKKGGKTGKVRDMYITDDGILILTSKGLQLVDKSTGNFVWDKPIKIKNAEMSLLLEDNGSFYAISKASLLKVDVSSRTATTLVDKIKFSGNEIFNSLEVFDDAVVLGGEQNVVGINKLTGDILYQHYFKPPGKSLVAIAQDVVLASIALAATYQSYSINSRNTTAIGGVKTVRYHQYTPNLTESGGSATSSNGELMYINTKFKDADASGFGLAKIDKSTGKILDKIVVGDRSPIYCTNDRDALVFFKSGNKELTIQPMN